MEAAGGAVVRAEGSGGAAVGLGHQDALGFKTEPEAAGAELDEVEPFAAGAPLGKEGRVLVAVADDGRDDPGVERVVVKAAVLWLEGIDVLRPGRLARWQQEETRGETIIGRAIGLAEKLQAEARRGGSRLVLGGGVHGKGGQKEKANGPPTVHRSCLANWRNRSEGSCAASGLGERLAPPTMSVKGSPGEKSRSG